MKKLLLPFILSLTVLSAFGQNEFPTNRNSHVLIDGGYINMIRPNTTSGWARGIMYMDGSTRIAGIGVLGVAEQPRSIYLGFGNSPWNSSSGVHVLSDGKVGIGVYSPSVRLDVNGSTRTKSISLNGTNPTPSVNGFRNVIEFKGLSHAALVYNPGATNELMFGFNSDGNFYWGTGQSAETPNYYSMFLNGSNGNLGIRGKLTANEVKVKVGGWSDFVFADDYVLPPLAEVEEHIKSQHHLTNIPSEAEVLENGIDLGAMDAKLLQKIEELTLYTIEQEKKLEAQQLLLNAQAKSLSDKEKQLEAILKRVEKLEMAAKP